MARRKQPNSRAERRSFFLKDRNVSKKNHSNTKPQTGITSPAASNPSSEQNHSAAPQIQDEFEQEVANLLKDIQRAGKVWLVIGVTACMGCFLVVPVCFLVFWLYCGLWWLAALGWSASLFVVMVTITAVGFMREEAAKNVAAQEAGDVFTTRFPGNAPECVRATKVVSSKIEIAAADMDSAVKDTTDAAMSKTIILGETLDNAFALWKEFGRRKIVPDEEYKRVTRLYDDAIKKKNQPCAESAKTPKKASDSRRSSPVDSPRKVNDSLVICPRCKNVIADRKEIKRRMNATFGSFTICGNSLKCPYCGEDVAFFL